MAIIDELVSKESIGAAKDVVKLVGFGLGNLLYRIYTGTLARGTDQNPEENRLIKGTSIFVLGGSIGTNGYTRELLPLYAMSQYRRRLGQSAGNMKDHRILTPGINSADAGALGATLAFDDHVWRQVRESAQKSYTDGLIPLLPLVDIGGTKINFILAHLTREGELSFRILLRERFHTPGCLMPDEFYNRLAGIIAPIIITYDRKPYRVIPILGLAQPGEFRTPTSAITDGAKDLARIIHV